MLGKGHGGLYNASTKEERGKRKAKRRKDQIKFIDLRFERLQVIRFRKARRRQDVPQIACSLYYSLLSKSIKDWPHLSQTLL